MTPPATHNAAPLLEALERRLMLSAGVADPIGTLLIVADPALGDSLSAYVDHKQSLGWYVDLFDTDRSGSSAEAIRGFIRTRYAQPETRPDAVLLVGDTDAVGHFTGSGGGGAPTDLYFGCMDDGDDWRPELPVGRFSARSAEQLGPIVEKTIDYSLAYDADWARRAAFLAGNDHDWLTEGTHDEMIRQHLDPLDFEVDRLYRRRLGATSEDVLDAIADGQGLIVFSGHGSPTGWLDGPPFDAAELYDITASEAAPLVLSFACDTGAYAEPECLSEAWLRAPAGGVAAFASSVDSYWTEDDALQRHVFSALFDPRPGPPTTLGSALLQAKETYLQQMGAGGRTRRYFEMYNLMGDPTVPLALPPTLLNDTLEPAMIAESYRAPLVAHGLGPGVAWRIVDGELPDGIALSEDGVLHGSASRPQVVRFRVRASDALGRSVCGELSLAATRRLVLHPGDTARIEPGTTRVVQYPAEGGEGPRLWTLGAQCAYQTVGEVEPAELPALPMGWHGDEAVWELRLPWRVSFGGIDADRLYVSSNGFVEFLPPDADDPAGADSLAWRPRIAAAQADLHTLGEGDDIHVGFTDRRLVIRWHARSAWRDVPVRAQIVLGRNGSVETQFLASAWLPGVVIGVSAGNGTPPALSEACGDLIAPAHGLRFEPTGQAPAGMWLDRTSGLLVGSAETPGVYRFDVRVDDLGPAGQSVRRDCTLAVAPPGDADCDGTVNATDLAILAAHWGQGVPATDVASGDLDGDGSVGVSDLAQLAAHWGQTYAPPPVNPHEPLDWTCLLADPEPGKLTTPRRPHSQRQARTQPPVNAPRESTPGPTPTGPPLDALAAPPSAPNALPADRPSAVLARPYAPAIGREGAIAQGGSVSSSPLAATWPGHEAQRPGHIVYRTVEPDPHIARPGRSVHGALPAGRRGPVVWDRAGEPDDLLAELCPNPLDRPLGGLV